MNKITGYFNIKKFEDLINNQSESNEKAIEKNKSKGYDNNEEYAIRDTFDLIRIFINECKKGNKND